MEWCVIIKLCLCLCVLLQLSNFQEAYSSYSKTDNSGYFLMKLSEQSLTLGHLKQYSEFSQTKDKVSAALPRYV